MTPFSFRNVAKRDSIPAIGVVALRLATVAGVFVASCDGAFASGTFGAPGPMAGASALGLAVIGAGAWLLRKGRK